MKKVKLSTICDSYTHDQKLDMWMEIHRHSKCPGCGAIDSMLPGPRGGLSINIKCKSCHLVFWTTPFSAFGSHPIRYDTPTQDQLHSDARLFTEELYLLDNKSEVIQ